MKIVFMLLVLVVVIKSGYCHDVGHYDIIQGHRRSISDSLLCDSLGINNSLLCDRPVLFNSRYTPASHRPDISDSLLCDRVGTNNSFVGRDRPVLFNTRYCDTIPGHRPDIDDPLVRHNYNNNIFMDYCNGR